MLTSPSSVALLFVVLMGMATTGPVLAPPRAIFLLPISAMTNRLIIGIMRPLPRVGGTMVVTHLGVPPRMFGLAFGFVGSLVRTMLIGMGPTR